MSNLTADQVFSMQMELTELRTKLSRYSKLSDGNGIESKMEELINVLSEKESEIVKLSKENAYFNDKFASVQTLLGQVEDQRASLVSTNESLEKKLQDSERHLSMREDEVATLQTRIQEAEVRHNSEIRELKTDNAALMNELERLRESVSSFEARQVQFEVLKRELAESNLRVREAQERFEDAKRNHERTEESLNASLSYLKRVIKEHELTDLEHQKKIQKCEKYRIEQTKKLNEEISRLNEERSRENAATEKFMKEKNSEIVQLVQEHKEEIDAKNLEISQANVSHEAMVDNVKTQITALNDDLHLKNECLKMKENETKLLQKQREELELKLASLEDDIEHNEKSSMNERTSLTNKIKKLEEEKSNYQEQVNSLEEKNTNLNEILGSLKLNNEKFKDTANSRITEVTCELEKVKISSEKVKAENEKLNAKLQDISDSLELATSEKTIVDRKNEKLKAELDLFIGAQSKEKLEQKRIIAKCKDDIKSLRDQLKKKDEAINELHNVKLALDERKEILKNMITQNRQLSDDYTEARSLASELKNEMDVYLREKECAIRKISMLEKQMIDNEKTHHRQLEEERLLRIETENKLVILEKELAAKQRQSKFQNELEKENKRLKDKIRRQEGFLKKKLDHDRALRQNNIHQNVTKTSQRKQADSFSLNGCYSTSFDES